MVYLRGRLAINRELRELPIPVLTTIEIPVILCNSFTEFHRVEMKNPGEPNATDGNFQLEVNYTYIDYHTTSPSNTK